MSVHKVYVKNVNDVYIMVHAIRNQGLAQGVDFDFSWMPAQYHNEDFNFTVKEESHCLFTFYDEQWGSWFSLKYL